MTTMSGVINPGPAESWATSFLDGQELEEARAGEAVMRPYIELARELANRLGLASPSLPTNRRSVE